MTKQNETRKRSVTINQQHINEQARTVAIAFSSEKPYRRYFGDEVLQHDRANVRMQRLENNAALLLDHDWTRQIGVVERAWLEEGKGRALVRFGKSPLAEEIFQDVIDGIRQHISVGYTVHEYTEDENNAGLINVTDWEPLEISIVSVPADTDVGVGRNHDTKQPQLKPSKENTMKNEESTTKSIEQGTDNERKRVSEIMAMGKKYGFEEAQSEFITEGHTPDKFRQHIIDALHTQSEESALRDNTRVTIGLNDKEARQFSFQRALNYLVNPNSKKAQEQAAFELDVSDEAQRQGMQVGSGIAVPYDVLARSNTHTMTGLEGDDSNASGTIKQSYLDGSFIDILNNQSVTLQLATHMTNLSGYIKIPKQTDSTKAFWVGEMEAAAHSQVGFDSIDMQPRTIGVATSVTKELLANSASNVEAIIRRDMATQAALAIDYAALYGEGKKQPLGLVKTPGIQTYDYADMMQFADFVELEKIIAAKNAAGQAMTFVMNPADYSQTKLIPRGNGIQAPIVDSNGTINGFNVQASNQIQKGQVFFGNFTDLVIGSWGGIELNVDPLTQLESRVIKIVMHQNLDFAVRRPESFVIANQQAAALKKGAK